MAGGRIRRHWKGLSIAVVALVAALVIGVPYVYIHVIEGEQPAPLALGDVSDSPAPPTSLSTPPDPHDTGTARDRTSSATTGITDATSTIGDAAGGVAGTWTIGDGSQAGYRVQETLAGQKTVAVGRTDAVTGSITISDTAITAADVTVDVADIASDNSQRDRRFTGSIMNTDQYPTAAFALTEPMTYHEISDSEAGTQLSATGNLTLHGTTKSVTFPITLQRTDAGLAATGTIDITYQDYGINNPSIGGFVSVGDSGTIEFLLVATRG